MLIAGTHELGRLESVDVRTIWTSEALDFTPWLRLNIDQLGEALGLDLEITEAEAAVGGFSVDLVGMDVTNGRKLIVENQLEPTDHGHLGQLLTYAGGLDAATIVWVARDFREEHRQALDWLNRHTDEDVAFFGITIGAVRIGTSKAAPPFRLVAFPNDWGRSVKHATEHAEPSTIALARQRAFTAMLEMLKKQRPTLTNASRVGLNNWFGMSAGRTGFGLNWVFPSDGTLRVELYIDAGDAPTNKGYLRALETHRAAIEMTVGQPLVWDLLPGKRAARISVGRPITSAAPDEDQALMSWGVSAMIAMNDALRGPIRTLVPLPEPATEPDPAAD